MRLSDAMRGAADRAPVDEARVSTADAARRVTRSRRLHTGANALVGAGAVAVLGMAFIGPVGSMNDSAADFESAGAADEAREESAMGGATTESLDSAADSMVAEQWMCGSQFRPDDGAWSYGDTSGVTYEVGEVGASTSGGEGEYFVSETITANRPVDLLSGSDYVITWDGMVVGRYIEHSPIQYGPADEPMLPDGAAYERLDPGSDFSTLEQQIVVGAVNCWDGAPLPAGTYEVHLAKTLAYPADDAAATDPSAGPGAEPGSSATPAPSDTPDVIETEESGDAATAGPAEELPGPERNWEAFRVAGGPVTLTIDGEKVDDPFSDYLTPLEPMLEPSQPGTPVEPAPLPDNALTPDIVRDLYAASAVGDAWDMEAGSHRWLMNDSGGEAYSHFGCTWGGMEGQNFPESSSTMELLDFDVAAPKSLSVSYGFVVDGNPEVRSTVTNVSEYDIYDYWGSAQPQLYLVRDGVIVAEGYPIGLNEPDAVIMEDDAEALIWPAPDAQRLDAGQSVAGDYLWRDITRCDTDNGRAAGVEAGVYTLLASTSLTVNDYASSGEPTLFDSPGDTADSEARALARESLDVTEPATAIAPIEDYTWVDLQLWTSLGTITVTG
ncbi:hypothetical protein [Demequina flava]|uniref:hypothetical protein n=1 Tax=Demequina flava TaxID=1095025 RepID=UPI0007833847|nr:hypothetical protein [Demequina flava]